jgi:raffinose/stachyose/melibiose transport system permease protein
MAKEVTLARLSSHWTLYLFVLPALALVAIFSYYPAVSAMYHAFYRWDMSSVEEFAGGQNFRDLIGWAPALWVLFAAWIPLMILSLTGRPARLRRIVPWVFAALVLTLGAVLWAVRLSGAADEKVLDLPAREASVWYLRTLVGSLGGLALWRLSGNSWLRGAGVVAVVCGFLWFAFRALLVTGDWLLWQGFGVTFVFVVANLGKMIPSIVTAVVVHRLRNERWQYAYRVLFVVPMIIPGMVYLLLWKFFYDPTQGVLNKLLLDSWVYHGLCGLDSLLGWGVFRPGLPPSWLGDVKLVIPSLIFWGFPWIGVVGVLIYLAGLASISKDVYEAADIDGINWFQKFTRIELPLIATQVRINLILMIIGTLQDYGNILIVLGDSGGPQGVALVPGLYMFRAAFVQNLAGKACAIGLILFVFILILTELNNRYVRVEK